MLFAKRVLYWSSIIFAVFGIFQCYNDGGYSPPEDLVNPLAVFRGSIDGGDREPGVETRAFDVTNPKVALVYHYVGPRQHVRTIVEADVETAAPYGFKANLFTAPPAEVNEDDEIAIGIFWLYSDRNNNGIFDRAVHPEYAKRLNEIDSLIKIYHKERRALEAISESIPEGIVVSETLYVGKDGLTLSKVKGVVDTVWPASKGLFVNAYDPAFMRYRVLLGENAWDRFFSLRKRANHYSFEQRAHPLYSLEIPMTYRRRVFPKPGKELEFKAQVVKVATAWFIQTELAAKYQLEAFLNKQLNYPYDGYTVPNEDWAVGRSRYQFLFYFPTFESIQRMRKASTTSSFKIANNSKIKPGYNLIACDDDYNCMRQEDTTLIRISVGMSETFFAPPSNLGTFIPAKSTPRPEISPDSLIGAYRYKPDVVFSVLRHEGAYWLHAGEFGATRLTCHTIQLCEGVGLPFKLKGVTNDSGIIEKIFVDWNNGRHIAVKFSDAPDNKAEQWLKTQLASPRASLILELKSELAQGARWFGTDTLRLEYITADSLVIMSKNLPKQSLFVYEKNRICSKSSSICLGILENSPSGNELSISLQPDRSYPIPLIQSPIPMIDSTILEKSQRRVVFNGNTRESYRDFQGKPRFSCSNDSLYFSTKDPELSRFIRSKGEDSIAIGMDDGFYLKIDSLESDSATWIFEFCAERAPLAKKVFLKVVMADSLGEVVSRVIAPTWFTPDKSGRIALKVGPVAITQKIHSLYLENVNNPLGNMFIGLDKVTRFE